MPRRLLPRAGMVTEVTSPEFPGQSPSRDPVSLAGEMGEIEIEVRASGLPQIVGQIEIRNLPGSALPDGPIHQLAGKAGMVRSLLLEHEAGGNQQEKKRNPLSLETIPDASQGPEQPAPAGVDPLLVQEKLLVTHGVVGQAPGTAERLGGTDPIQ